MAGKQIGKFRQWAGEKLGSATNKGALTEDFKELELDVTLRSAGVERLSTVSQAYIKALTKKLDIDIDSTSGKTLPAEALGLVMIGHGDEFGEESVYGQSLVKFGRAHCKIANIQEEFANTFTSTYVHSLEEQIGSIKEYQAQRKKLDSRRLALDASLAKASKVRKEKDKAEAELEVEVARKRYDEISEEVQERMVSIQQHEKKQLADLMDLLKLEMEYIADHHKTLLDLQAEWPDINMVSQAPTRRPQGGPHTFTDLKPKRQARRSIHRSPSSSPVSYPSNDTPHRHPLAEDRFGSQRDRAQSVPSSLTRNRSDSTATSSGYANGPSAKISSWMGSMTSRSRGNSLSKKNFQELMDDELERPKMPRSRPGSIRTRKPPPPPPDSGIDRRSSSSSSRNRGPYRLVQVRALYDFFSSAKGELEFHKGDIITLIDPSLTSEKLMDESHNDWVDGELNGVTGLIPLSYTEVVKDDHGSQDTRPSLDRFHTKSTIKANRSKNVFSDSEDGGNLTQSALSDEDEKSALRPNAYVQSSYFLPNPDSKNHLNRRSTSSPELVLSPRDHSSFADISYPSSPVDSHLQYHQQLLIQQFQHSSRNRSGLNKYTTAPHIYSSADEGDTPSIHHQEFDVRDNQDALLRAPQRRLSDLPPLDLNTLSLNRANGAQERPALALRVNTSYRKPPPPPPPPFRPRAPTRAQTVAALGPPPVPPPLGPQQVQAGIDTSGSPFGN
ncbi:uncharacterized protein EI90DRAFT_3123080 [Cantharellus anzutake]|uniref:uncharacterized protein n=1 Tax=Cantharellus anzutake TaxID=1750568 RepID=UPI00190583D7|nr:uncharacterized protein EI90DRAFT_3123080 [Cantharellus anzutake]KAF8331993.1 hypothetical protein EI90DRAFT_3123080 [Cantharellus anzutake]